MTSPSPSATFGNSGGPVLDKHGKVIGVVVSGIVLQRFDPEAALRKSGLDYLVVTSRPPTQAMAGKLFTYKLAVIAKNPKVEFKLESGPKGMAVCASGEVTWPVPAEAPEGVIGVILSVRDATARDGTAQEVFHTFALRVVK